jgi:hypothetical protein
MILTVNFRYKKIDCKVLALAYFPRAQAQVSSALKSLTSVFEMGTGVASSLETPRRCNLFLPREAIRRSGV